MQKFKVLSLVIVFLFISSFLFAGNKVFRPLYLGHYTAKLFSEDSGKNWEPASEEICTISAMDIKILDSRNIDGTPNYKTLVIESVQEFLVASDGRNVRVEEIHIVGNSTVCKLIYIVDSVRFFIHIANGNNVIMYIAVKDSCSESDTKGYGDVQDEQDNRPRMSNSDPDNFHTEIFKTHRSGRGGE